MKRWWLIFRRWLRKPAANHVDELKSVSVLARMASSGWCGRMGSLLGLEDWDSQEKVLAAMQGTLSVCQGEFATSARAELAQLSGRLERQLKEEPDNDYLEELLASAKAVHSALGDRSEL